MHPSFSLFPGLRRAAGTLACLALLCTATAPAAAPVPDSSPRMTPVVRAVQATAPAVVNITRPGRAGTSTASRYTGTCFMFSV